MNAQDIKNFFKDRVILQTPDLYQLFKENDPDLSTNAINWRIHNLVKKGILNRVGRGKFSIADKKLYSPYVNERMKLIYSELIGSFKYSKFCIWNTISLNEFMLHQPFHFYLMIETENELKESVFHYLREAGYSAYIDPTKEIILNYLPYNSENLIIRTLISESPVIIKEGIKTASLEKILLDIFCDEKLFHFHQGEERKIIFREAAKRYVINRDKMLRYAARRRKKEKLIEYLNQIGIDELAELKFAVQKDD